MERIVYLLGAGFSAPLGLPVISNFLEKSQDMYNADRSARAHFEHVFKEIRDMSAIKNYYSSDMFNIEEILSILEMREFLDGSRLRAEFITYIKDVIEYYTPPIRPYGGTIPGNWPAALFGSSETPTDGTWRHFGCFVSNLFNVSITKNGHGQFSKNIDVAPMPNRSCAYGIITLNYDLVLEAIPEFLQSQYTVSHQGLRFQPATDTGMKQAIFDPTGAIPIAKLHGSVDNGVMVPPTWSKGASAAVVPAWNLAHRLLAEATQLRMIGFSLPVADAYIKYLIKSAAMENSFLKRIDVICLDDNAGTVRERYRDFVKFTGCRFARTGTFDYMAMVFRPLIQLSSSVPPGAIDFNWLESAHEQLLSQFGTP